MVMIRGLGPRELPKPQPRSPGFKSQRPHHSTILNYFLSTQMLPFGVPRQPLVPFAFAIKALEAIFVLASVHVLRTRTNVRTSSG